MSFKTFVNNQALNSEKKKVDGAFETIDGERFYKISNHDQMTPFFMTLLSPSDHWMFISSNGGLSAGRKNEDNALFPYYTDDKITASSEFTGSKTILHVKTSGKTYFWEPFSGKYQGMYSIDANLYKNVSGSRLIFEEVNNDLGLAIQYSWQFSEKYGFVKNTILENLGKASLEIEFLDGLQNLVPTGVSSMLQNNRSNLVNAYKRNELHEASGLGIYALSAMIVDKAVPAEALMATTVWAGGVESKKYLLSSKQLEQFRKFGSIKTETDVKGEPGAYFISGSLNLKAEQKKHWFIVAEVNQGHHQVNNLIYSLENTEAVLDDLKQDIQRSVSNLENLVAKADGLQLTGDLMSSARHFSNVLFNIMRGGIFDEDYLVQTEDLIDYIQQINQPLLENHKSFFSKLPEEIKYTSLIEKAREIGHPDIVRVCYEYLPIYFSRRHGDPSRPWNKFSIETRNPDGTKSRAYQGNWRDIFQNWEALAYSFPSFAEGMIAKFLNASTLDGYNPYRISRKGIDWEVIEPDDPWSYIGYWGDHQIIYLQKLLEVSQKHHPGKLSAWMNEQVFVYANVPYRIKGYDQIVENPRDTIDFDQSIQHATEDKVSKIGSDGKLCFDQSGELFRASFTEKILVTLLSKLSNFVPEGGIWLNTQRPEWNDANNALVGYGVSMVTLYYLRRFISFLEDLYGEETGHDYVVHEPVQVLFNDIYQVLKENQENLTGSFDPTSRKAVVDSLGNAGEKYRRAVYGSLPTQEGSLNREDFLKFLKLVNRFIDHSIEANKRRDGLYHSYNLLSFTETGLEIDYLYEMLEGQVAVLSSGKMRPAEVVALLDKLKASDIYREDQYSYLLYPNRNLPGFLEKNLIPREFIKSSKLAAQLESDQRTELFSKDQKGAYFFSGSFQNADDLKAELNKLKNDYPNLVEAESKSYLEVFEKMFNHRAFTGRSGTFFGYEGLGSIYWHMVSKLLLAVQETIVSGDSMTDKERGALIAHYYEVRAGIGINKSPELYGAFPSDPYSHTPFHKGAQQPGMTGQVKEDVLNRWAELGVSVQHGELSFHPDFINPEEFLKNGQDFRYLKITGEEASINIPKNALAFTYCQVPVIYQLADKPYLKIDLDGKQIELEGQKLNRELSSAIFERTNQISIVYVGLSLNG